PVMEWYYKSLHVDYQPLPPLRDDCANNEKARMDFIYPKLYNAKLFLAKDFNGEIQPVILKVAHSDARAKLFWYVDNVFKGTTETFHELQLNAATGTHYVTVVDEKGNEIFRKIELVRE
ncbi:MAG: penicillin-binding protein 1C, partial [Proteobacteria bacterium]